MSLIDELRKVADKIPPSHVPSLNELAGVLGAFIIHTEHGDSLFKAAEQGAEGVAKLLAPVAADAIDVAVPEAAPLVGLAEREIESLPEPVHEPAPEPTAAPATDSGDQATIAELRSQLDRATVELAQYQRTQAGQA